jgi:hypothetical protein
VEKYTDSVFPNNHDKDCGKGEIMTSYISKSTESGIILDVLMTCFGGFGMLSHAMGLPDFRSISTKLWF